MECKGAVHLHPVTFFNTSLLLYIKNKYYYVKLQGDFFDCMGIGR